MSLSRRIGRPGIAPLRCPGARLQYGPDKIGRGRAHRPPSSRPTSRREALDGVCTTTVRALDEPVERLTLDAVDLEVSARRSETAKAQRVRARAARRSSRSLSIRRSPRRERDVCGRLSRRAAARTGSFSSSRRPSIRPRCRARVDAEPGRERALLVSVPRLSAREADARRTTIVVPEGTFALGNGALVERVRERRSTTFRYRQDVPHSTYLMTMVAGPFVEVAQRTAGARARAGILLRTARPRSDGERAFGKTPQNDRRASRSGSATPYPYARYSQIAVADFIFGGMENTSATTQTDRTLHDETRASRFLERSARLARTRAPVVRRSAHLPRLVARVAQRGLRDLLRSRLARSRPRVRRVSLRRLRLRRSVPRRRRRSAIAARSSAITFRDPIETLRPPPLRKGRRPCCTCCAANSATRASGAPSATTSRRTRGERRDDRLDSRDRRSDRPQPARLLRSVGFSRRSSGAGSLGCLGRRAQGRDRDDRSEAARSTPTNPATVSTSTSASCRRRNRANSASDRSRRAARPRARRARARNDLRPARFRTASSCASIRARFVLGSRNVRVRNGLRSRRAARRSRRRSADSRGARACQGRLADGARDALREAFGRDPFWGVLVEAARAIGADARAMGARRCCSTRSRTPTRKCVRAAAEALGKLPRSPTVAAALIALAARATHRTSCAPRRCASLGKTRDPRAFDVLVEAARRANLELDRRERRDARARRAGRRARAGADSRRGASGQRRRPAPHGGGVHRRAPVRSSKASRTPLRAGARAATRRPMFLVQLAAIGAAESLGRCALARRRSTRVVPTGASTGASAATRTEAAMRIREAAKSSRTSDAACATTSTRLREEQRRLQEKIETLARP